MPACRPCNGADIPLLAPCRDRRQGAKLQCMQLAAVGCMPGLPLLPCSGIDSEQLELQMRSSQAQSSSAGSLTARGAAGAPALLSSQQALECTLLPAASSRRPLTS